MDQNNELSLRSAKTETQICAVLLGIGVRIKESWDQVFKCPISMVSKIEESDHRAVVTRKDIYVQIPEACLLDTRNLMVLASMILPYGIHMDFEIELFSPTYNLPPQFEESYADFFGHQGVSYHLLIRLSPR